MHADEDIFAEFKAWYEEDTAGDPDFIGRTAQQWINFAEYHNRLQELLSLRERGMSMREWYSINFVASSISNPFPDVRRKGGDHDRGFTPVLNAEMRKRHHHPDQED